MNGFAAARRHAMSRCREPVIVSMQLIGALQVQADGRMH
jgi:hypothetical protein